MHIKVGDMVKVISGKDKGKVGKILKTLAKKKHVLIEGVNIKTKHVKARQEGETGSITRQEASIHSSNVMHYSQKEDAVSRIGYKKDEQGNKVRYLIKTQENIT